MTEWQKSKRLLKNNQKKKTKALKKARIKKIRASGVDMPLNNRLLT